MVRTDAEIVSKAMEKVPMTVEGFQKIEAELHRLKAVERPRIIQQISDAREHGDLSAPPSGNERKRRGIRTDERAAILQLYGGDLHRPLLEGRIGNQLRVGIGASNGALR